MKRTNVRWTVVALIFFATTVNYIDRQVIGLLKPYIQDDLGWTEADYGYIVTAFQVAYGIGMLLGGRMLDRLGSKLGYSIAIIVWSLGAMAHATVRSVTGFGAARAVLGLGEAGNFPAAVKVIAEWFPKRDRAFATGVFNSGTTIGAIIAPIIVAAITLQWGWRWAFIVTGLLGFIWVVFWWLMYHSPEKHPRVNAAELAYIHSDEDGSDGNHGNDGSDGSDGNEDYEDDEEHGRRSPWWQWLLVAIAGCIVGFLAGYFVGQRNATIVVMEAETVEESATASALDSLVAQTDSTVSQAEQQSTAATQLTDSVKGEAVGQEQITPKADEAEDYLKYEAMDERVRHGAYNIIGTAEIIKAREGDTSQKIAHRTLGDGMECYIEVYNGIDGNTVLKEGQEIKMPKLRVKKSARHLFRRR